MFAGLYHTIKALPRATNSSNSSDMQILLIYVVMNITGILFLAYCINEQINDDGKKQKNRGLQKTKLNGGYCFAENNLQNNTPRQKTRGGAISNPKPGNPATHFFPLLPTFSQPETKAVTLPWQPPTLTSFRISL